MTENNTQTQSKLSTTKLGYEYNISWQDNKKLLQQKDYKLLEDENP